MNIKSIVIAIIMGLGCFLGSESNAWFGRVQKKENKRTCDSEVLQKKTRKRVKKRILIFTSNGGGGQVSVNKALLEQLSPEYEVVSTLYFPKVAKKVDPVSWFTLGYYTGEDLYNYCQKKGFFGCLQGSFELSRWYYYLVSPFLVSQTTAYIEEEKPDLVISIIPIVNNMITKACARNKIPLLIVPPDFDIGFYTQDLRLKGSMKKYVNIALPFDNDLSRESLKASKKAFKSIEEKNISSFQYPLRKEFYQKKDVKQIKKDFDIIDESPVILLMMGAQGSNSLYTFTEKIMQISHKAHLIVCAGKHDSIISKIKSLKVPSNITLHLLGYTTRIADLMEIADVMIGKTGAISLVESLYSRLPLIADQTEFVVSWEMFHQKFIEEKRTGFVLKKLKDLPQLLTNILSNPELLENARKNIDAVIKEQSQDNISLIVKNLVN